MSRQKKLQEKMLKAKFMVEVKQDRNTCEEKTQHVTDLRTGEWWTEEQISKRGISKFQNFDDVIETLNWNLNGDTSQTITRWTSPCTAEIYIFD